MPDWLYLPRRILDWELRVLLQEEEWEIHNVSPLHLESIGISLENLGAHHSRKYSWTALFDSQRIHLRLRRNRLKIWSNLKFPLRIFMGVSYLFDGKIQNSESLISIVGRFRLETTARIFWLIWWNFIFVWYIIDTYMFIKSIATPDSVYTFGNMPIWAGILVSLLIPVFGIAIIKIQKFMNSAPKKHALDFIQSLANNKNAI